MQHVFVIFAKKLLKSRAISFCVKKQELVDSLKMNQNPLIFFFMCKNNWWHGWYENEKKKSKLP